MKALLLAVIVFATPAFATASEDFIGEFVSSIDWQRESVDTEPANADKELIARVEFEKEGVWRKQSDLFGVYRHPNVSAGENKPFSGVSKGWGGSSGGHGSGMARLTNFSKEGFTVKLLLSWSNTSQGSGGFNEEFSCAWIPDQSFERRGFKVRVTLKPTK